MLREVTCLIVGVYAFIMIFGLAALAANRTEVWDAFVLGLQTPFSVAFHAIALIYMLIYHTFAWFELAPKAMPIQLGKKFVPGRTIVIAHYVVWVLLTVFIFWLAGVF
jgi:fumarate reductase subunit C